ncbi:MAG: hypothetical protein Q9161_008605 [Pseudevernia consocians]
MAVIEKIHPPNSLNDHEQAVEIRQEHPDTGRWILEVGQLKRWMDPLATDVLILWVNGIPGAGKTVVASLIIEEMKRINSVTVAYLYCKYSDVHKNSLIAALRSILAQMIRQNEELLAFVYEKCASSSEVTLESPALLKELVETSLKSCTRVYILLDGLDECAVGEEKKITAWLLKILQDINKDNPGSVRGLLISQRDAALERLLTSASVISLDGPKHQKDIEAYCQGWSLRIKEKFDIETAAADEVATSVAAQADGLFLFAKLVMTNLFGQTSRRRLFAELQPDCFPKGLEAAYERIAHRVFENPIESEREDAQRILSWVVCARRPLKWHEFQGGIFSIDTDSQTVDFEDRRLRVTSKDLCGSLIEIRPGDTIELYLNFRCFDADLTEREVQDFFQKAYYSLEDYAIVHWIDHLASCTLETLPRDQRTHQYLAKEVETFLDKHGLDPSTASSASDNEQIQCLKHWDASLRLDSIARLAHEKKSAASYLDLEAQLHRRRSIYESLVAKMDPDSDIAKLIISFNGRNRFKCPRSFCEWFYDGFLDERRRNEHLNQHDRPFRCTFEACLNNQLGYGTEKDLKSHLKKSHPTDGNAHWTFPLPNKKKELDIFSAARVGDLELVRRSVEELGISANSGRIEGEYRTGMTPLCEAVRHNQVEVVKYLLAKEIDVNIRLKKISFGRSDTALGLAVNLGHTLIAELLLENRATSDKTLAGRLLLNVAVISGNLSMVKLLVDRSASESGLNLDTETPIEQAAKNGDADMLRYLLNINIAGVNTSHESSLWVAVLNGHKDAARVFFENGALQSAVPNHSEDVSKETLDRLLQYGILETDGYYGRTALHWASFNGDAMMTGVLLKCGLRIEVIDHDGQTALHLACQGNDHSRKLHVDILARLSDYLARMERSNYAVVQLLLEKGANAEAQDGVGERPLHKAVLNDDRITQLLLSHGVDADARNYFGQRPGDLLL